MDNCIPIAEVPTLQLAHSDSVQDLEVTLWPSLGSRCQASVQGYRVQSSLQIPTVIIIAINKDGYSEILAPPAGGRVTL